MKRSRANFKQTAIFAPAFVATMAALDWLEGGLKAFSWYAIGLVFVAVLHLALTALFGD
jgi:hypothetical protein